MSAISSQSVCICDEKLQKERNHLLLWNDLLLGSDRVELKRDVPEVCNQLQFYTDNALMNGSNVNQRNQTDRFIAGHNVL